jgi:predicted alpha/beta-hydrolase family hydrolase
VISRIYLAHGASGNAASMRPFVDGLEARGMAAAAVELPKRKAEDAVPAWIAAVPDGPGTAVGGHSFGGRVASLAAAQSQLRRYAALVLFSYPLHPPGQPSRAAARTAHWPDIACPVLLLSGEADPFARIALLRDLVHQLPEAHLVTFPKLGHTLRPRLEDVLDLTATFLQEVSRRAA